MAAGTGTPRNARGAQLRLSLLCRDPLRGICQLLYDFPVKKVHGSFGGLEVARIVRDHADSRALFVQVPREVHHGCAIR
jgi:hypothetical protein